jgi:hypothetical protein
VLPLGRQPGEGREPLSEQRSEGQPGYLEESLLHLHPHRAPITATQPTDILLTDIRATHSRAMDIPPTRALGIRVMDTLPTQDTRLTDTPTTRHIALTNQPCDG